MNKTESPSIFFPKAFKRAESRGRRRRRLGGCLGAADFRRNATGGPGARGRIRFHSGLYYIYQDGAV